ncbi:MAG: RES family NAD+ phosphorylase [Alphaproteobacteria bacterium]
MRFIGRCYRGHDPIWSFSPLSGEGASKTGGRFNRKGQPTLYLSLDVMTSFGECTQGLTQRLQPLTMCEYDVDCEPVADLRDERGRGAHHATLTDLGCAWLRHLRAGGDAPSWLLAERLKAEGYVGLLTPSFVANATPANCNLVLWRWGPDLPTRVAVFDPTGRLPKNQLSWSRRG